MTRIIDVEARAMERDTYRPMFRCNDIDRRKDRKIVVRPNDGPSPTRDQDAAEARARLMQRSERITRMGTYSEARQQQADTHRNTIIGALTRCGAMTTTELIRHTRISPGSVFQHLSWLERHGTIRRTAMSVPLGQIVIVGLTEVQNEEHTDGQ